MRLLKIIEINAYAENDVKPIFTLIDGKKASGRTQDYKHVYDDNLDTKYCVTVNETNQPFVRWH